MSDDRRADRPAKHFWQKPNWMGPILQAAAMVVVGLLALNAGNDASRTPQVGGLQTDRSGVAVQLVDGTVIITCGTASAVPVTLIRKYGASESTVVCQQSGMVLP